MATAREAMWIRATTVDAVAEQDWEWGRWKFSTLTIACPEDTARR